MQSAHKLYSEAPELSLEELGQARLSRGLGNLLAGRTSLRLAYAQKMAGLPLTIPEETLAEAEAQMHDSHYETMWSTQHSRGNLMETQFETPLDTMSRELDPASNLGVSTGHVNELYYLPAPDSLGVICTLLFLFTTLFCILETVRTKLRTLRRFSIACHALSFPRIRCCM